MGMSFTVAIIGRPNVGKSTLFNRLVGRRMALVDDRPGVTRDRREGEARLGDLDFTVIDTAGAGGGGGAGGAVLVFRVTDPAALGDAEGASLAGRMLAQTKAAVAQAD